MAIKPLCIMSTWRHPRTRDRRLAVLVVLARDVLGRDNGVRAEIMDAERLILTFAWPRVMLDTDRSMRALLSFSNDLHDG